ncbi:MAG: hypothetical protein ACLUDF_03795 [Butyricicoccus sp.]
MQYRGLNELREMYLSFFETRVISACGFSLIRRTTRRFCSSTPAWRR